MEHIDEEIARVLMEMGIDKSNLDWTTRVILILAILLVSYIVTKLFRHALIPAVRKLTAKTKAKWDDYLFNDDMLHSFSRMIPPIIFYLLLPFAFDGYPYVLTILLKACLIYLVVTTLMLVNAFLKSLYEISNEHETLRYRPLKGIYQMVSILAFLCSTDSDNQHPHRPECRYDSCRTGCFGGSADADIQRQHPRAGGWRTALGERHAASGRLGHDGEIRCRRVCERSVAHHGEGAELRQDHHHHSPVCLGERFVPELARDVGDGRKAHQAFAQYRYDHHPLLHR